MLDTILRGARVVDGTGAPSYTADVGLKGGKIEAVGPLPGARAAREIDAQGLVAAPGLIDIHTHADLYCMRNRQRVDQLCQGVTTEAVGLCGLGFAPLAPHLRAPLMRYMRGIFGPEPAESWQTFAEFQKALGGCAINETAAMTHNAARLAACGFENLPMTGHRLGKALSAMEEAMQAGAVGFSVGLSYYPGGFGGTGELIDLCRVAAKYDVPLLAHIRVMPKCYGVDAEREMVAVARETGVHVHVLHHRKPAEEALRPFREAMAKGCRFTFEFDPYLGGCGFGLVFLPPWAHDGGPDALMERLDQDFGRLVRDVQPFLDLYAPPGVSGVFTSCGGHPEYVGLDFETVARMRGQTIAEMVVSVLRESELNFGFRAKPPEDETEILAGEAVMKELIQLPMYTVGSDSIPYGDRPHPRAYGTFARMLKKTREWGLPLEAVIHKLTGFNAALLRLRDRGLLLPGMAADVILFDPDRVADRATWDDPRNTAAGMEAVFVNGKLALRGERPTGELAGLSLRRG